MRVFNSAETESIETPTKPSANTVCAQLKAICLVVLGNVFYSTQNVKAEKMLSMAYMQAKKMRAELLAYYSNALWIIEAQQNGSVSNEKILKQRELVQQEEKWVDNLFADIDV